MTPTNFFADLRQPNRLIFVTPRTPNSVLLLGSLINFSSPFIILLIENGSQYSAEDRQTSGREVTLDTRHGHPQACASKGGIPKQIIL